MTARTARITRRLGLAVLALAVWLTLAAAGADASRGPDDDPDLVFRTPVPASTAVATTVDWTQYALVAAVACLLGVAATAAVLTLVRRTRRPALLDG
jgi:hypothetical protein